VDGLCCLFLPLIIFIDVHLHALHIKSLIGLFSKFVKVLLILVSLSFCSCNFFSSMPLLLLCYSRDTCGLTITACVGLRIDRYNFLVSSCPLWFLDSCQLASTSPVATSQVHFPLSGLLFLSPEFLIDSVMTGSMSMVMVFTPHQAFLQEVFTFGGGLSHAPLIPARFQSFLQNQIWPRHQPK
jgi:hypothetical protein